MPINLIPLGNRVKVEITGQADMYVRESEIGAIIMPADGTSNVVLPVCGQPIKLSAITDISISGVAITNQADFDTKIATVFPKAAASALTTAQVKTDDTAAFASLSNGQSADFEVGGEVKRYSKTSTGTPQLNYSPYP